MTHPHDPPRQWPRPVEEVARAIWRAREERTEPRLRRLEPDEMDMVTGAFGSVMLDAKAATTRLISLCFINENGIEAMKAEKAEKEAK